MKLWVATGLGVFALVVIATIAFRQPSVETVPTAKSTEQTPGLIDDRNRTDQPRRNQTSTGYVELSDVSYVATSAPTSDSAFSASELVFLHSAKPVQSELTFHCFLAGEITNHHRGHRLTLEWHDDLGELADVSPVIICVLDGQHKHKRLQEEPGLGRFDFDNISTDGPLTVVAKVFANSKEEIDFKRSALLGPEARFKLHFASTFVE